jgi:hypothetical protein
MKINIAITMDVQQDANQSIWYNGANQHCIFLVAPYGSLVMGLAAALRSAPLNPAFVSATPAAARAAPRKAPPTTPTSGQMIPMTAPAAATKGIAIQCRAIPGP